jgi:16S rRNA G1207 methylase RsmC
MLDGQEAVVVFTAGVMVDAVPFAADARDRLNRGGRLLIVAESRDVLPTQLHLAAMLRQPAAFVSA